MKTTIKAVSLLACVFFLAAMVRMQYVTFAGRTARRVVSARVDAPSAPRREAATAAPSCDVPGDPACSFARWDRAARAPTRGVRL